MAFKYDVDPSIFIDFVEQKREMVRLLALFPHFVDYFINYYENRLLIDDHRHYNCLFNSNKKLSQANVRVKILKEQFEKWKETTLIRYEAGLKKGRKNLVHDREMIGALEQTDINFEFIHHYLNTKFNDLLNNDDDLNQYESLLSRDVITEMIDRIKCSRHKMIKTMNKVVHEYMPMVTYCARSCNSNKNYYDLVNEGVIAIYNGIYKFDPSMGVKFSTYVRLWIKQRQSRHVKKFSRIAHVSYIRSVKNACIKRDLNKLSHVMGKNARLEDLCDCSSWTQEDLERYYMRDNAEVSIDATEADIESTSAYNFAELRVTEDQQKMVDVLNKVYTIKDIMRDILTPRDRDIVIRMFNLNREGNENGEQNKATLESVGRIHGITRERVRQILSNSIEKIRQHKEVMNLMVAM